MIYKQNIPNQISNLYQKLELENFYAKNNYYFCIKNNLQHLLKQTKKIYKEKNKLFYKNKNQFKINYIYPFIKNNNIEKKYKWKIDYKKSILYIYTINEEKQINNIIIDNGLFHETIERLYQNSSNIKWDALCPTVTFQVTDACNLKCSYCYQINKGNHTISLDTAKKFIDLLLENNEQTQQYINTFSSKGVILEFIGGEPLLEINLIDQIIKYFRKRTLELNHPWQQNWRIGISSNGTLYFQKDFQNFIKKYFNFLSFSISIDGNKELHDSCRVFPDGSGSYDIAIKAARHFKNYWHGTLGSKITLSPQNIKYTSNAIINFIKEGYTDIYANCIFEKGWNNMHAQIYYNELIILANYIFANNLENKIQISLFNDFFFHPKDINDLDNWCGGNGRMIAINYTGNIYPCLRFMESSLGTNISPIICGNISDGLMPNEDCQKCIKQLKSVNRINQSTQECIDCPIAEGCAWCQAYNYQDSGTFFHRATYICCMHKARALANVYYWNLYYRKNNINKRFKLYLSNVEALKIIDDIDLQILKHLEK